MKLSALLIALTFLCSSYRVPIDTNDLVGSWKVVEFDSHTPELSPVLIKQAEAVALSTEYELNADHSCKVLYMGEIKEGKWSYNPENQELNMQFAEDGSGKDVHQILSLENGKMKTKQDVGELGYINFVLQKQ